MSVFKGSPLGELARLRDVTTRRISSWDKTGGNMDYLVINPGQTVVIADIEGAGCINHIWCTHGSTEKDYLRKIVFRGKWDHESDYSINVPLGDFFGVGHAKTVNYSSLPLQMSPDNGRAFNCWFPMPFATHAEFSIVNESNSPLTLYYYIDFEIRGGIPEDMGRFHASWNRECPTEGAKEEDIPQLFEAAQPLLTSNPMFSAEASDELKKNLAYQFGGNNIGGKGNYVVLDAEGKGHYVGCNINYHNLRTDKAYQWPENSPWPPTQISGNPEVTQEEIAQFMSIFNWYGEGDDMIFIDGEEWPPSLHGTGTEDYFNTAYCPAEKYDSPYHGMTVPGGPNWGGKSSYYRFHIEDPIHFRKSIKVTIEHGHNNNRSDDISSTAYWYQAEPHKPFSLANVEDRIPLEE